MKSRKVELVFFLYTSITTFYSSGIIDIMSLWSAILIQNAHKSYAAYLAQAQNISVQLATQHILKIYGKVIIITNLKQVLRMYILKNIIGRWITNHLRILYTEFWIFFCFRPLNLIYAKTKVIEAYCDFSMQK